MSKASLSTLMDALDHVCNAPTDSGRLELIVRRPAEDQREVLEQGELDLAVGLVGDSWDQRPSGRTGDGSPHPEMQLNLMNVRVTELVAGERERWPLCGDQLYVDLDLREENLPPGTRLAIGGAVIEVTDQPHRGCAKFSRRFGGDALKFVNSPEGTAVKARGINAKVVQPGTINAGDSVTKI
ncbi:MAG: MOSC domain-containing protein [Actinomycetia bacterium]|nr:MOSC domain-containing protein [Actinomycetes bacterium]